MQLFIAYLKGHSTFFCSLLGKGALNSGNTAKMHLQGKVFTFTCSDRLTSIKSRGSWVILTPLFYQSAYQRHIEELISTCNSLRILCHRKEGNKRNDHEAMRKQAQWVAHANDVLQRLHHLCLKLSISAVVCFKGKRNVKLSYLKKKKKTKQKKPNKTAWTSLKWRTQSRSSLPMFPIPVTCTKVLCGEWICYISFWEALYRKEELLVQLLPQLCSCFVRTERKQDAEGVFNVVSSTSHK